MIDVVHSVCLNLIEIKNYMELIFDILGLALHLILIFIGMEFYSATEVCCQEEKSINY